MAQTPNDLERRRRLLAAEREAAAVYRGLAARQDGEERDILLALARAEERHAAHWARMLDGAAPSPVSVRSRVLAVLARRLAPLLVLAFVERSERGDSDPEMPPAMAADERVHAEVVAGLASRRRTRLSGPLRAAVFGVNDGLVSNLSLVLGVAAAGAARDVVLLSGIAGLLAGALSMAAGEFLSVRSQRALLERADPLLDAEVLGALRHEQTGELALVHRARGMGEAAAKERAREQLDGVLAVAVEHLSEAAEAVGTAVGAAGWSFVAFALGATLPVLPFLFTSGPPAEVAAALLVGAVLFATGAATGVVTGEPVLRRGLLQLAVGTGAALATYALGSLLGVTVV